jgi:hypothetical protein
MAAIRVGEPLAKSNRDFASRRSFAICVSPAILAFVCRCSRVNVSTEWQDGIFGPCLIDQAAEESVAHGRP